MKFLHDTFDRFRLLRQYWAPQDRIFREHHSVSYCWIPRLGCILEEFTDTYPAHTDQNIRLHPYVPLSGGPEVRARASIAVILSQIAALVTKDAYPDHHDSFIRSTELLGFVNRSRIPLSMYVGSKCSQALSTDSSSLPDEKESDAANTLFIDFFLETIACTVNTSDSFHQLTQQATLYTACVAGGLLDQFQDLARAGQSIRSKAIVKANIEHPTKAIETIRRISTAFNEAIEWVDFGRWPYFRHFFSYYPTADLEGMVRYVDFDKAVSLFAISEIFPLKKDEAKSIWQQNRGYEVLDDQNAQVWLECQPPWRKEAIDKIKIL
jgi:hypothetical protein